MSNIILRDYQKRDLATLRDALRSHKHVIFSAIVSYGKTVIMSEMARLATLKNKKVLIVSHRAELMSQTGGMLSKFGMECQYISPKHRNVPTANVVSAMAQTLQRRIEKKEWQDYIRSVDMVLIDECHCGEHDFLHESGLIKDKYVIGFSGTPSRTGHQRQLGLDYDYIVNTMQVKDMIVLGNVTKLRTFTINAPDLSNVKFNAMQGDFDFSQMARVYDKKIQYDGVIENYRKICNEKKAICFDANQINAIKMCVQFNESGIKSKFIVSGFKNGDEGAELVKKYAMYTGKREDVIREFHEDKFTILCNASILSTGFNEPTIECVILNRATQSVSFYIQALGRAVRLADGKKEAFFLDFGNNVKRLGRFEDDRTWSLWHIESSGGGVAPIKECPKCQKYVAMPMSVCPFCGYVYPTKQEIRQAELEEIVDGETNVRDMNLTQLQAYAELKGYSKYWVFRRLWMSNDERKFRAAMQSMGYSNGYIWGYIQRMKKK